MTIDIFGNGTQVGIPAKWEPEPTRRGTWDILSTCIITLILCIWSAVHTNVPEFRQASHLGLKNSTWRKLDWSVLSWLAPEAVAFTAWHQRRLAKNLTKEFNKNVSSRQRRKTWWHGVLPKSWVDESKSDAENEHEMVPPQESHQNSPWTLPHGFLAAMGGFAVEPLVDACEEKGRFLTYSGALFLARFSPEILPQITNDEIEDGSKANTLTKLIACLQGAWFCIGAVHRMVAKYPISLLELNTFGHAFCALIIYLMWWDKPSDLPKPFVIHNGDTDCTTQLTLSYLRQMKRGLKGDKVQIAKPNGLEVDELETNEFSGSAGKVSKILFGVPVPGNQVSHGSQSISASRNQSQSSAEIYARSKTSNSEEASPDTIDQNGRSSHIDQNALFPGNVFRNVSSDRVELDPEDAADWRLVSELYSGSHPDRKQFLLRSMVSRVSGIDERIDERNKYFPNESRRWDAVYFTVIALAGPIIYGGLHALAWTAEFPSRAEKLVWQISVVAVMGGMLGPMVIVIGSEILSQSNIGDDTTYFLPMSVGESAANILTWIFICTFVGLFLGLFLLYVFGRIYFIVESFIQLFHLPPGVYDVPAWSQYIPHMS